MPGLYYEEFEIDHHYRHELTRTVTEADNTMFSLMSMNPQPLHVDAHFSEGTEWGQRIFNSLFTLAIMVGLTVQETTCEPRSAISACRKCAFPTRSFMAIRCARKPVSCRRAHRRKDERAARAILATIDAST